MKIIIIAGMIFFVLGVASAQYAAYPIKEQYDKRHIDLVDNNYTPCNILPQNIPSAYGDGMSYVLESYIRMYETTNDKGYLIKFINNVVCMQENRRDEIGIGSTPRWVIDPDMYRDGLIIWGMSHFVYLVKVQEPGLYALALPQIQNTKITNHNFPYSWSTYGDFAEWLRVRTEQTLDW